MDPAATVTSQSFSLEMKITLDGIISLLTGFVYWLIYSEITKDPDTRKDTVKWLQQAKALKKYKRLIKELRKLLKKFYGKPFSLQALTRSYSIALTYPVTLFLLAYTFLSGSHQLSGYDLLPSVAQHRWVFLVLIIVFLIGFWLLTTTFDKCGAWIKSQLERLLPIASKEEQDLLNRLLGGMLLPVAMSLLMPDLGWTYWLHGFTLGYFAGGSLILALTVAGIALAVFSFTDTFSAYFTGTITIGVAAVFAVAFSFSLAAIGSLATAVVIVTAVAAFGDHALSIAFLILWVLFPFLNAILDWLSLGVSRYFLKQVQKESHPWWVFQDIVLDLVVAMCFMVLLVALFPAAIEAVNYVYALFSEEGHIDWHYFARVARSDPWGEGFMVTMMLVTTLIPTLVHVFLAFFALLMNLGFGRQLAEFLGKTQNNFRPMVAALWIEIYGLAVLAILIGSWILFQHFLQLPIADWLYGIADFIYEIPHAPPKVAVPAS